MNGLWLARHVDANAWYHMYPFAMAKNNSILYIVRHKKPLREVPNSRFHLYKSRGLIRDLISIFNRGFQVIKKENIDYIITFNPVPWGIIAWLLAKIFRKPIILGYIGADFHYHLKQTKLKYFLKFINKRSEIVTVTGSHMIGYLNKMGVNKNQIKIFPHCIAKEWFIDSKSSNKKYDVIDVCNLIKRKRVKDIINALAILKSKGIKINFAIVGDGPEKSKLENMVREKDLNDYVYFLGYQKNVLKYLKESKIYVQASNKEGLSISLIEAMAAGLVPITTVAGSEKDHIKNGYNGYFFRTGNINELATKIILALEEYDRLQKNVLEYRKKFDIENAINTCEKLIEIVKGMRD